ncbi:RopGEF8, partial [Trifolium medium]|nr:RopGEF8 [Trifolium medium]
MITGYSMTKNPSLAVSGRRFSLDSLQAAEQASPNSEDGARSINSSGTPPSMTLSDFMGWSSTGDDGVRSMKRTNSTGDLDDLKDKDEKSPKKHYYLEKLEYLNAIR